MVRISKKVHFGTPYSAGWVAFLLYNFRHLFKDNLCVRHLPALCIIDVFILFRGTNYQIIVACFWEKILCFAILLCNLDTEGQYELFSAVKEIEVWDTRTSVLFSKWNRKSYSRDIPTLKSKGVILKPSYGFQDVSSYLSCIKVKFELTPLMII